VLKELATVRYQNGNGLINNPAPVNWN